MDIAAKHISSRRRIGTLHGKPVIEMVTHGGLHLVVIEKNGKTEIIGSGPHRAVSRYIAEKREPDLVIAELSKSDYVDEVCILSIYDRYSDLTDHLNGLMNQ